MKPSKKQDRNLYNLGQKIIKAAKRKAALIELGKTVETTYSTAEDGSQITHLDLPVTVRVPVEKSVPRLTWLGGKTYVHSGPQSKLRPGNKELHAESIVEDAGRTFAKEVDKALNPPPVVAEGTPVPVVPLDAAPEAATL